MEKSTVAEFYKDRSVFVTGGTGFMGKVLIEKLLRSCPQIECIYILMRPSRGKDVDCRHLELINNQIFDNLRKCHPEAIKKISILKGDICLPQLGLSQSDLEILKEKVSIVFNSAATVRFDEKLKVAFEMNVKGPMKLLDICRQMKRLEALVHVSTAFSNLDDCQIKEEVPSPKTDPNKLVKLLDSLTETEVETIAKKLLANCPNTYTFTKALTEQLLVERRGTLPLVIVRPSIVTAALNEPHPGWVDNMAGATASIVAVSKGFTHVYKVNSNMVCDIVPVDLSINLMISVGWYVATNRPDSVDVYFSTTGQQNAITWGNFKEYSVKSMFKYPTKDMMWYPSAMFTTSETLLAIGKLTLHYLPAAMLDLLNVLLGKRTKWVKLYAKAHRAFSVLEFFTTNQWSFVSKNSSILQNQMSKIDRHLFNFDVRKIEWPSYFERYVRGTQQFTLKQAPADLPQARRNLKKFYLARFILYAFLLLAIFYVFKAFLLPFCNLGTAVLFIDFLSYESTPTTSAYLQWKKEA